MIRISGQFIGWQENSTWSHALSGSDVHCERRTEMRYLLLWVLGIPVPILIVIWALGGFD
jgi:hypothetical protein